MREKVFDEEEGPGETGWWVRIRMKCHIKRRRKEGRKWKEIRLYTCKLCLSIYLSIYPFHEMY